MKSKEEKEAWLKERKEGYDKHGFFWAVKQQFKDMIEIYPRIAFSPITMLLYVFSLIMILFPIVEGGEPHILLVIASIKHIENASIIGPPYISLAPFIFAYIAFEFNRRFDDLDFDNHYAISIILGLISIALSSFIYYYIVTEMRDSKTSLDAGHLLWYLITLANVSLLIDLIFSKYERKRWRHRLQILFILISTQIMGLV